MVQAIEQVMATAQPAGRAAIETSLPRDYYVSDAIYQEELRKVFHRQWLLVGHTSSLRNPGDHYVRQVGPESMIFARDKDHRLRAFFNVCRHRGYRMLADDAVGCSEGIVCPYHKWTYDIGGSLRRVPGTRDGQDFDFADWSLHEAQVDEFHGWIHVWLGTEPAPPLAEVLTPVSDAAGLSRIDPAGLKLIHRQAYIINANWKAMMENDMECYHCGHGGHPSLAVSCNYQDFYIDAVRSEEQYFPLREGMTTLSTDGERVCAKPLAADLPARFSTGFLQWPMFCGLASFVDHVVTFELTPLAVDRCQFVCEWYVSADAVEGVDYDVAKVIELFHVTNLEDVAFGEANYNGIRSQRFVPGPLHPRRENGVIAAYTRYREMMAAA